MTPSSLSPTSLRVLGFYRARQGFAARPGLRHGQRTVELAHACLKKQGYPTNLNFVIDMPLGPMTCAVTVSLMTRIHRAAGVYVTGYDVLCCGPDRSPACAASLPACAGWCVTFGCHHSSCWAVLLQWFPCCIAAGFLHQLSWKDV